MAENVGAVDKISSGEDSGGSFDAFVWAELIATALDNYSGPFELGLFFEISILTR